MKYLAVILLMGSTLVSYSQAFEIQVIVNNDIDRLTVEMRNVSAIQNNPATGEMISTISFQMTGRSFLSGIASTDYTLGLPNATTDIVSMSSTALTSPANWSMNTWIPVIEYNLNADVTAGDFIITMDTDGDRSDPFDPVMSVATTVGFNQILSVQSTILPIELLSFQAESQDRFSVLNWSTTSELYASHFEIERSINGIDWTYIAELDAYGTSSILQQYSYVDEDAHRYKNPQDQLLYRLRMVDLDGSYEYSLIRQVQFEHEDFRILTYPNPTTDVLHIDLSGVGSSQHKALYWYDHTGSLVQKTQLLPSQNKLSINLKSNGWSSGIYAVRLIDESGTINTSKIVLL